MHRPPFLQRARSGPRGSVLILAVTIVAILAIVGLSFVKLASREGDSVGAKRRYDKSISCADAARNLLMSKFSTYGVSPTSITFSHTMDGQTLRTGHYDTVAVASVTASTDSAQGSFGVNDVSNRISRVGLGGQVYRMTVVCSANSESATGAPRQTEVEYLVRFGL